MPITHAFVSGIADGADTTLVRPVDWNATHLGLTVVRKTADETVNNSSTLQNDDHLLFAVAANEVWEFRIILRMLAASATPDYKFALSLPALGSGVWVIEYPIIPATTLGADVTTALKVDSWTGGDRWCFLQGVYVGGANAGNVQLQWAQYTANASDSKVTTNSCIIAHKLA